MEEIVEIFVEFSKYCPKCKHVAKSDTDEPCNECLDHGINLFTDKPVRFEEK